MPISKIDVTSLHCDQGMGTLVKVYDDLNKVTNLALLDLGSESGTKKYSDWDHVKKYKRRIYTTIVTLDDPPKTHRLFFTINSAGEIGFFVDGGQAEIIPPYERFDRYPATPHTS